MMSGVTEQPPRVHPILAIPLLPFVLAWDILRWIGRQLERGLAAVGRFIWWLLTPVRWVVAQLWLGLVWVARQIGHGLRWFFTTLIAPVLVVLLIPFVYVGQWVGLALVWVGRGLAWVGRYVVAGLVYVGRAIAAAARWIWRGIGPFITAAWRTAEWMATKIWRGIAAIGRGIAWLARVIYWPIRPFVRAAAAAGRAVRNSCRTLATSVRESFGMQR